MQFNDIETKLINLALNHAAHDGEASNAASMLFKQLRKRGITAQQFNSNSNTANSGSIYESMYRTAQYRVSSLTAELASARQVIEKLKSEQSTQTFNQAQTAYNARTSAPRTPRTKFGSSILTPKERDLLTRIGRRAEGLGNMHRSLYGVAHNKIDHGTVQQLLRKGVLCKGGRRGYHALTPSGVEYYNKYCKATV